MVATGNGENGDAEGHRGAGAPAGVPQVYGASPLRVCLPVVLDTGRMESDGVGSGLMSVALGDINMDGRPECVTAASQDDAVSLSDWTFADFDNLLVGVGPMSAVFADVNTDGQLDIVAGNYSVDTVSILLGHDFGSFAAQTTFASGAAPRSVAVADVE